MIIEDLKAATVSRARLNMEVSFEERRAGHPARLSRRGARLPLVAEFCHFSGAHAFDQLTISSGENLLVRSSIAPVRAFGSGHSDRANPQLTCKPLDLFCEIFIADNMINRDAVFQCINPPVREEVRATLS